MSHFINRGNFNMLIAMLQYACKIFAVELPYVNLSSVLPIFKHLFLILEAKVISHYNMILKCRFATKNGLSLKNKTLKNDVGIIPLILRKDLMKY